MLSKPQTKTKPQLTTLKAWPVPANPQATGRAWVQIDLAALRHNAQLICQLLPRGSQLMAVVKADAYGHGATIIARELQALGCNHFAVATISEAIALRQAKISGEILVLGYTHPPDFPLLQHYQLTQTIINFDYARQLSAANLGLKAQIKIDSGMHRLGEDATNIRQIAAIFSLPSLQISGIYSHLATSDLLDAAGETKAAGQIAAFDECLKQLKLAGIALPKTHLLSSYGLLNFPRLGYDYARIGLALYGAIDNNCLRQKAPNLLPVLSVHAKIALVRQVAAGSSIGYGLSCIASKPLRIALLSIGYADGLPRNLAQNQGCVLIAGQKAPILGPLCMDQMLVDISHISSAQSGGEAIIIGSSGANSISAIDFARHNHTIANEVFTSLGTRLPRITV